MLMVNFIYTHKQQPTSNEITSLFLDQIKLLLKDHYVLALFLLGIIMGLFIYAVCLVGMKHSFYGKINLGDAIKEGVDRIGKTTLIVILMTVLGVLSRKYIFTSQFDQTFYAMSLTNRLCIGFFIMTLFTMPMMLFPAVFVFSEEGPWWAFPVTLVKSLVKAFAIYYKNILKYVYLFLIAIVFWIVMYLIYRLGVQIFSWWLKNNQESIFRYAISSYDAMKNLIRIYMFIWWCIAGVAIYVASFLNVIVKMSLFILYPELLENEDEKENAPTKYSELSETFFRQLPTTVASQAGNQDASNTPSAQGSVTPNNGGEGLSVPISHKSDKPFLNQKIDKEEFDRLTSKE